MRPSALVHLVRAAQANADRGFADVALCELGPIYTDPTETGQQTVAAGVMRDGGQRHWAGAETRDVFTVKAHALAALEAAGAPVDRLQVRAPARSWWHPGRSGALMLGPKTMLAEFGELHPRVLRALDVTGPLWGFEVFLDVVAAPKDKPTRAKPPFHASEFMPLTRDFAFIADAETSAQDFVKAAAGADKALISDVSVFDVFAGESLGVGKKSLALQVTLQPRDATLDDKAIEAVSAKIIAAVQKVGGVLRR